MCPPVITPNVGAEPPPELVKKILKVPLVVPADEAALKVMSAGKAVVSQSLLPLPLPVRVPAGLAYAGAIAVDSTIAIPSNPRAILLKNFH